MTDNSGHERSLNAYQNRRSLPYSPVTWGGEDRRRGVRVSQPIRSCSWAVLRRSLPLCDQLLGDLGLSLQPGQPGLLVHASHLLAGGKSPAHGGDDLAVGGRLLFQGPRRHQVQAGAHLRPAHDRVGAGAVAAGGLAVGAHEHSEQPLYLAEGSGGGAAEGAVISHRSSHSNWCSIEVTW